jgi:hypothetical protein
MVVLKHNKTNDGRVIEALQASGAVEDRRCSDVLPTQLVLLGTAGAVDAASSNDGPIVCIAVKTGVRNSEEGVAAKALRVGFVAGTALGDQSNPNDGPNTQIKYRKYRRAANQNKSNGAQRTQSGFGCPLRIPELARARPSLLVAPPSSTSGAWGGFGVLLYTGSLGPRRWILVSQRSPRTKSPECGAPRPGCFHGVE